MAKKKFALIGASGRGRSSYALPIVQEYADTAELVGIYDINYGRACVVSEACGGVPVFKSFEELMEKAKPDCIIVTTVDKFHAEYIIKGIKAGVQVFTEKPMCINEDQCRAILEAEREYNNYIGACFNDRYTAHITKLKELMPLLGDIYTVNYEWMLARPKIAGNHGASYYRRWNAYMDLSGGLAITKATHHFDNINWLVDSHPKTVSAFGKLRLYGKNGTRRAKRCSECPYTDSCEFYYQPDSDAKKMYVDNEKYDGYMIDRCVFDENIDIYDTMCVAVEYENGTVMTYTETSNAPYEGFKMNINGEKGRFEVNYFSNGGLRKNETFDFVRFIDLNGNITTYSMPIPGVGSHGGSDTALRNVLFAGKNPPLEEQRCGSHEAAFSVLLGTAVNKSIKEGRPIDIKELIGKPELLERDPDFDRTKLY